jgi:hypothetical protein
MIWMYISFYMHTPRRMELALSCFRNILILTTMDRVLCVVRGTCDAAHGWFSFVSLKHKHCTAHHCSSHRSNEEKMRSLVRLLRHILLCGYNCLNVIALKLIIEGWSCKSCPWRGERGEGGCSPANLNYLTILRTIFVTC